MKSNVLFLRGINVGGRGRLLMPALRSAIVDAGGVDPRTHIQSGNAVFQGDVDGAALAKAIEARAGFRVPQVLLDARTFMCVVACNPYQVATCDPKSLHVGFLSGRAECSLDDLNSIKSPEERVTLSDHAVYLYSPKYLSGSRLAPRLDKLVGVTITLRNWRTVEAVGQLLGDLN